MKPLVSVLIPVYGVESYIEECAISVFNQSYENLEIIFVNDCTKDSSMIVLENVLKRFPIISNKVKIINHGENLGLAGARLTALKAATGDYVIQFDSDDYVEHNMLELLVEKAIEDDADIVICDMDHVYETYSVPVHVNPSLNNIELISKLFTGEVHSSLCNKLIRRKLYTDNNINPTIGLNMCEDFSVMYKLVYYSKRISYLPQILYHYRQNVAGSFTAQKMPLKHQLNRIQLLEQISSFIQNNAKEVVVLNTFFRYLLVGNKGEMLLYGSLNHLNLFKRSEMVFSLKDIFNHPNLHVNLKLVAILDKLKLKPLICILRFIINMKK